MTYKLSEMRDWRIEYDWSAAELAEELEVTRQYIYRIESGAYLPDTLKLYRKFADLQGVKVTEVIDD